MITKLKKLAGALAFSALALLVGLPSTSHAQDTLQIGSGGFINSTTTYPAPYGNYYYGARHQFIVNQCELLSTGFDADTLKGLAFFVQTANGAALTDFTISIGHTAEDTLAGTWLAGLTQVFYSASYTESVGWNYHDFSSAFAYNGTDNIVIEVCFNNTGWTNNAIVALDEVGETVTQFYREDAAGVCANASVTGTSVFRPTMQFVFAGSAIVNDVLVSGIVTPETNCGLTATETVSVAITNNTSTSQSSFPVSYRINGGSVVSGTYTATLPGNATDTFTFATTADLSSIGVYAIEAWTELGSDQVSCNDTLAAPVENIVGLTTFPYIEDFDGSGGLLVDRTDDDFDWTVNSGTTVSGGTGPSDDVSGGGNYLYTEASGSNNPSKVAVVESPCITVSGLANPYMDFYYHMFGDAMGTLALEVNDGSGWTQIWSTSGSMGDQWKYYAIPLDAYNGQTIRYRFVGTTGATWSSDIALDNIRIHDRPAGPNGYVCIGDTAHEDAFCFGALTANEPISFTLYNFGTTTLTNFSVGYSINGAAAVTETVAGPLNPGASMMYTFATGADLTAVGTYNIATFTNFSGELDVADDTASVVAMVMPSDITVLGNDTTICDKSDYLLDGTGAYVAYNWSTGATSQTITINSAGTYGLTVTDGAGCQSTDSVVIATHALPMVNVGNDTSICAGGNISLDAGAGFTSYQWQDGSTSQTIMTGAVFCPITLDMADTFGDGWNGANIEFLQDGTPIDTITLANGTAGSATLLIPDSAVIQLVYSAGGFEAEVSYTLSDQDGNILFADGPNPATDTVFTFTNDCGSNPLVPYTVTVADANTCSASDTVIVQVINTMTVDLGPDTTICAGDMLTLDAGFLGANYVWSTSETTQTINPTATGQYIVTVTQCGSGNDTVNVTVNALPTVSLGNDTTICMGDSVSLDAGAGFAAYQYSTGHTGQTEVFQPNSTFRLDMFDSFGDGWNGATVDFYEDSCLTGSYTFTTGNSASVDIQTSSGTSFFHIDFTSGGFPAEESFELYDYHGNLVYADGPSPTNGAGVWSGTYTFAGPTSLWAEVVDNNGCANTDTIVVNTTALPGYLPTDTLFCDGGSVTVDATGAGYIGYFWNTGASTPSISVDSAGCYFVLFANASGCVGIDMVGVDTAAVPAVDLGPDTTFCPTLAFNLTLDAGSHSSYVWTTGATSQTINITSAGTYAVTVTDALGCTGVDTLVASELVPPTVSLGNDTSICMGDTITLDAGAGFLTYLWNNGGMSQTADYFTAGDAIVAAAGANGCPGLDTLNIAFIDPGVAIAGVAGYCSDDAADTLSATPAGGTWSGDGITDASLGIFDPAAATTNMPVVYYMATDTASGCIGIDSLTIQLYDSTGAPTDLFISEYLEGSSNNKALEIYNPLSVAVDLSNYAIHRFNNGATSSSGTETMSGMLQPGDVYVLYNSSAVADIVNAGDQASTITFYNGNDALLLINTMSGDTIDAIGVVGQNPGTNWSVTGGGATSEFTLVRAANVTNGNTTWFGGGENEWIVYPQNTFTELGQHFMLNCTPAPPMADFVADTVCAGNATTFTDSTVSAAGVETWSWNFGDGTGTSAMQNPTYTYAAHGSYNVWLYVTDSIGQMDSTSMMVVVDSVPVVDLGADTAICMGDTVMFDAGAGAASYAWSNGASGQMAGMASTNTLYVTVTGTNGCTSVDSVNVMVNALPTIDAGADIAPCLGDSVSISATGAALYTWVIGPDTAVGPGTIGGVVDTLLNIDLYVFGVDTNGCIGSDTVNLNVLPLPQPMLGADTNFCENDSYMLDAGSYAGYLWNDGSTGQMLTADSAGTYSVMVVDSNGCMNSDSIMLNTLPIATTMASASICDGDSIMLGGMMQTMAGTYYDTLVAANGCDSIVETMLTVNMPAATTVNAQICTGDSLFAGGAYQTASGMYMDTLMTSAGCDSIVTTNLTVVSSILVNASATICDGDSIFVGGAFQTMAGTYTDSLTASGGCDSVVVTVVSVAVSSGSMASASICAGDSIMLGGAFQTMSGTYYDTLMNAAGCDSIVETMLTVVPVQTTMATAQICTGDSIFLAGAYQTMSGTYTDTLTSTLGCDSIIETTLAVVSSINVSVTAEICDGDSVFAGGAFQTTAGMYMDTLTASGGCDSIVTTTVVVNMPTSSMASASICVGDSIFVGGAFQTTAGTYTDTFTGSNGCDSVVTTTVTVLMPTSSSTSVSICNGDSVFAGGAYQFTSGTYIDTFTGSNGCDSVLTTTVTVITPGTGTVNVSICEGDSVFAGGAWQTAAGTYSDVVPGPMGCDSTVNTVVSVNSAPVITVTASVDTICFDFGETAELTASGAVSYAWSPATGLNTTTGESVIASPENTTTYMVVGTDGNGCEGNANYTIVSEVCGAVPGIANATTVNAWVNQRYELLNFRMGKGGAGTYQVEVYNMLGQRIHTEQISKGDAELTHTISLSGNAVGTYFLRLKSTENVHTKKVYKE